MKEQSQFDNIEHHNYTIHCRYQYVPAMLKIPPDPPLISLLYFV